MGPLEMSAGGGGQEGHGQVHLQRLEGGRPGAGRSEVEKSEGRELWQSSPAISDLNGESEGDLRSVFHSSLCPDCPDCSESPPDK